MLHADNTSTPLRRPYLHLCPVLPSEHRLCSSLHEGKAFLNISLQYPSTMMLLITGVHPPLHNIR